MGVDFTDAEEEAAAAGVSRNLDAFERLRKLPIPLDTEPAMSFRPVLAWTQARRACHAWRAHPDDVVGTRHQAAIARRAGVPPDHGAGSAP